MIKKYLFTGFICAIILSCDTHDVHKSELTGSLYPIEELSVIPGAENATITIKRGSDSYFVVEIDDISNNDYTQLGTLKAWCIDWQKPLDLSNGVFQGIKIYSTFKVEKWNKLNYLLNSIDDLWAKDTTLTFREFQIAIWTLRSNPKFDINAIALEDLPSSMLEDGKPNFNYLKVENILDHVEANYEQFEYLPGSKYALVLETPPHIQTIFAVVD